MGILGILFVQTYIKWLNQLENDKNTHNNLKFAVFFFEKVIFSLILFQKKMLLRHD